LPDATTHLETDVLVVGGGGAGARAAIAAQESGARVILATKHFLGRSGCTPQLAYISAVGPWGAKDDSVALAVEDLLRSGGNLGDPAMLRILVEESAERIVDLESYGARFDKDQNGKFILGHLAGHSRPRTLTFSDRKVGSSMMQALTDEVRGRKIFTLEQVMLTKLFGTSRVVTGGAFLDYKRGEFFVVSAKCTVLASGGYGAIYSPSTVSKEDTGDGLVLALNAGTELIDMENVPFLPSTNRAWGSQKSWGETPHFLNTKGERFMTRYNPGAAEFGTKEILVQSIAREVKEGRGTKRGGVYSDLSHLPWDSQPSVRTDMSDLVEHGKKFGYDPRKDPVEIWPVAHTPTGGIPVDANGETSVSSLFAAGSVAYGIYGFGRIEGFTSMITQVFGKRAGEAAAKKARSLPSTGTKPNEIELEKKRVMAILDFRDGERPASVKEKIHSTLYEHAWVLRDEESLSAGLDQILKLKEVKMGLSSHSKVLNMDWVEALEVPHLLLMAELLLRASLMRKESRGAFSRTDYPKVDEEHWRLNIAFKKNADSSISMYTRKAPPLLVQK
jgi:fumarate reductase (CoM/CoB) subunit A